MKYKICHHSRWINEWYGEMDLEIFALQDEQTIAEIPRNQVPAETQIVKSTWVFDKKRDVQMGRCKN
jgi:hypothetical protein